MRTLLALLLLSGLSKAQTPVPLSERSYEEIIDQYSFIGDFGQKKSVRDISKELFWKYPILVPLPQFPIEHDFGLRPEDIPKILGDDKPVEHLNYGRVLFQQGNIEEARKVWLAARHKYGRSYDMHRRADYLIGLAYLQISKGILKTFHDQYQRTEVRLSYSNVASFFSWAFILKKNMPDPFLDSILPRGLYNLAAIYFTFGRYNGAHAAADQGLDFLRRSGRKEYRGKLRRIVVENWIKDRNYLRAMQELDTMIRQDPDPEDVAYAFSRVGDIYFDLYNYELAEETYAIGDAIRRMKHKTSPFSFIARGESLFWMGEFEKAEGMLRFGISENSRAGVTAPLDRGVEPWAKLRIADTFLARLRNAIDAGKKEEAKDLHGKTMLALYRVSREYPNTEAAKVADVRRACLGLPQYEGNNIKHARQDLAAFRLQNVPLIAMELGWSCEIMSYAREETPELMDRIKEFVKTFPKSQFLFNFIEPMKVLHRKVLDDYFAKKDAFNAISYYEKNKVLIFDKPSFEQQVHLFRAYVTTMQPKKAMDFWPAYQQAMKNSMDHIVALVYLSEMAQEKDYQQELAQVLSKVERESLKGVAKEPQMLQFWHRLMGKGGRNLEWMERLSRTWTNNDADAGCSFWLPVISAISKDALLPSADLYAELGLFIAGHFPRLFHTHYNCAGQALDLEKDLAQKAGVASAYAQQWQKRLDWPFKRVLVPFAWSASLILEQNKDLKGAQKLWEFIAAQDAKAFVQVAYAKLKLEPLKTEVGDLWKN